MNQIIYISWEPWQCWIWNVLDFNSTLNIGQDNWESVYSRKKAIIKLLVKICKLINRKIQNYRIVLRKKIAACSKFAVTLALNTICYWMHSFGNKIISIFIFWLFDLQIFFTNLKIAFFWLYTDFHLSWTILKVELKSRTFQIQHGQSSYKI